MKGPLIIQATTEVELYEKAKQLVNEVNRIKRDLKVLRCKHGHYLTEHPACASVYVRPERVAVLDIESSGIDSAEFGGVYSFALLEIDDNGKPGRLIYRSVSARDRRNHVFDRRVVNELVTRLNDYTKIITHYGSKYDIPWLYTRALRWGLDRKWPAPKSVKLVDTWILAKTNTKMSHRLESLERLMTGETGKTHMDGRMWEAIMAARPEGLAWLRKHNIADVYSTWRIYQKLRRFESPYSRRYL
jgi:uncharacterized protein YprB with RNaseH-like and TPR domain